jgi:hypothetical protein
MAPTKAGPAFASSALQRRGLGAAWAALGLATALLLGVYDGLPAQLPLLRDATGWWTTWAPKSPLTALRIPLMGAGQLGAATVMLRAARRQQAGHWTRFWFALVAVAALKSVIETLQIALLGAHLSRAAEPVFYAAALFAVVVGVGWAAHLLWRARGRMKAVELRAADVLLLCAALGAWLLAAVVPLRLSGS